MDRIAQVALNTLRLLNEDTRITSSNLANLNTIGFRRDINTNVGSAFLKDYNSFSDRVFANRFETGTDTATASLTSTDNPLDVAIHGDGYFVLQNPAGEKVLSRRGDLNIDANGQLRNGDNALILGDGGPITIPPSEKIEIAKDGTISYRPIGAEGNAMTVAGRLSLVKIPPDNVQRGLDGFLRPKTGPVPASDSTISIASSMLEGSNVNAIDSMVNLIKSQRAYETQIKLISTAKEIDTETSKLMRSSS